MRSCYRGPTVFVFLNYIILYLGMNVATLLHTEEEAVEFLQPNQTYFVLNFF